MALVDLVLSFASRAQTSKAPSQWWWAAAVFVSALIAGILIARQIDAASAAAAAIEIDKARARDLRDQAQAEKSFDKAKLLVAEAEALEQATWFKEGELLKLRAELERDRAAISKARSWEELGNV